MSIPWTVRVLPHSEPARVAASTDAPPASLASSQTRNLECAEIKSRNLSQVKSPNLGSHVIGPGKPLVTAQVPDKVLHTRKMSEGQKSQNLASITKRTA